MAFDDDNRNAPQSLNITIAEIERYLSGEEAQYSGEMRARLNQKLADLSEWWFKEGFAIAHQMCQKNIRNGKPIDELVFHENQAWLAPDVLRRVDIQSPADERPDASWTI